MSSLLSMFGFGSSRDNDLAQADLTDYQNTLQHGQQQYQNSLSGLNSQSNALANQNFMQGAQDAYGTQQGAYNQQQQAAGMLYNQATGAAPSAADLQMQAGLGNANNQVQSAALSQQGGVAPGLSQRNMLNAQAAQNANIVSQGQANRATELNNAQQNYNQAAAGMSNTANQMEQNQQALGKFGYDQKANNLNYQTSNANNLQSVNAANASNLWNAQDTNIQQSYGAQVQQNQALGNTIGAAASLAFL